MERTSFSLLFYIRRDKTNKKGEAPVFMRLTINGEHADASIKRFIEPLAWNSAKGKANEKSRGGKDLNLYLDAISANILRIQRDLELDKKEVSAQIILNRYLGKAQSDRHTLMEVFRAHNEKCRELSGISLAPATVIRYETTLRLTEEFLQKSYQKEDCYLDEVTNQFIEDFEFFLKTVRRCCHNTTSKYLMNFKKIVRIALAKGWMKKDPFAQVHFHFEPVEREFLEKQELKTMLNKEITITRLAQVRDIFCFCCLTGLPPGRTGVPSSNRLRKTRREARLSSKTDGLKKRLLLPGPFIFTAPFRSLFCSVPRPPLRHRPVRCAADSARGWPAGSPRQAQPDSRDSA